MYYILPINEIDNIDWNNTEEGSIKNCKISADKSEFLVETKAGFNIEGYTPTSKAILIPLIASDFWNKLYYFEIDNRDINKIKENDNYLNKKVFKDFYEKSESSYVGINSYFLGNKEEGRFISFDMVDGEIFLTIPKSKSKPKTVVKALSFKTLPDIIDTIKEKKSDFSMFMRTINTEDKKENTKKDSWWVRFKRWFKNLFK